MLACARLGAPHSVVFGGFSADALRTRIDDAQAKVVITADGGYRARQAGGPQAGRRRGPRARRHPGQHVLVVRRTGQDTAWNEERDVWWHEVLEAAEPDARGAGRSRPSTRSSSSTRRARPESQRESSTPPAAT